MLNKSISERRSEPRTPADEYSFVEFQLKNIGPIYQFKVWDVSDHGLCILVNEASDLLHNLNVGVHITMRYHERIPANKPRSLTTRIAHITKKDTGKFKGHYLIGLAVAS